MMRVAIDPGHPTRTGDYGCQVGDGTEVAYALSLANHLAAVIRHSCEPVQCYLTRTRNDEVLSLSARGQKADEFGADFVVSLHVNSHDSMQRGAIMFYLPRDKIGAGIAAAIADAWPDPLRRRKNQMFAATDKPDSRDDWLIRARNVLLPYQCPAVLVETGFASHPEDLKALLDPAIQSAMVAALMVGISRMRQVHEGSPL